MRQTRHENLAHIRAITLDLDDTLWPFAPIAARIEHCLHAWFQTHAPAAARAFPPARMREVREAIAEAHPEHAHDPSTLRRLCIAHALRESGCDVSLTEPAYSQFYAERNRVEFYDGAREALATLAQHYPICALTNGNADLDHIGIAQHFKGCVRAREFGAAKPDAGIFHAACALLDVAAEHTLHIGDDALADVMGAKGAHLQAAWIDHAGAGWPPAGTHLRLDAVPDVAPDFIFPTFAACVVALVPQGPP